jgi:hypothetical protein
MTMYSHCMFMYDYPDWGFSVLFPQLYGKCQGKTRKDGTRPTLFLVVVLLCVLFVFLYVFLCSLYSLFCDIPCIVCVYMCTVLYCTVLYCTVLYCTVLYCTVLYCTVLLPPGGYPIAVKYISYILENPQTLSPRARRTQYIAIIRVPSSGLSTTCLWRFRCHVMWPGTRRQFPEHRASSS